MPESSRTLQSDTGTLARVLVKDVRDAFVSPGAIGAQWAPLNYTGAPDFEEACREGASFAALLRDMGVEVVSAPPADVGMDSLYVRDASVVCDHGAILCSMGKEARRREPAAVAQAYDVLGIRVAGAIAGAGRLEGGDVVWLAPRTVAVGRGYRTNAEGIGQLRDLLDGVADEVIEVHLPHWNGPADVFHLMSVLSPLAEDLALVYSPLLPVSFREELVARGIGLVEVPDEEFDSMGCNVLAVAPRRVVALEGNPITRRRLEEAGVEVRTYRGEEVSVKGCGGPTCLTRPLERVRS
jgi:N-dimethylarginine dimethylaminohydrolase